MKEIKCDTCGKIITDVTKAIVVKIEKNSNSVKYECCQDECTSKLFGKMSKHWSCNNQSSNGSDSGDDT